LLFFNGIGLLWKRRIIEKNNGLNSEFDIENNIQNAEDFSVWKMSVLDPNGGNVSFIKNNDFVTRFNHEEIGQASFLLDPIGKFINQNFINIGLEFKFKLFIKK